MTAYAYPLIIKQLLITPLQQNPLQEIVYRDKLRLTYKEFGERVHRLGSALTHLGAHPGQTIAVMDWDSHRYLECFFAIPMLGCVLQTVNIRLSPDQILYTLNHTGAEIIICNTEFLPVLEQILPRLETAKTFIGIDESGQLPHGIGWAGEYETLLATASPTHDFPDFDENTRATTFFTTGTTGLPKGVYYTHRQIMLHTLVILGTFGLKPGDVYMPITPMFHVHAWGNPYAATLRGLKQVYPGRYAPDLLVRLHQQEGVTYSHCVPTIMQMFLAAADGADLTRWRVVIGGSALSRTLAQTLKNRGVDVVSGYGMSETGPFATIAHVPPELADGGEQELALRCRAGRPAPLVDLRLMDADGISCRMTANPPAKSCFAPWLTQGYLKNDSASYALWAGGWLHTGDIATIDEHGYVHITDRVKDVIKTGGEWVSSLDLEDILTSHPSVAEAAVIGIKDARWGERPVAIIVTRPGMIPDPQALAAHMEQAVAAGQIPKYALPDRYIFTESIAKTSVGKLDKKALRIQFADPA